MRPEDRLRSRCRLYLKSWMPAPPEAFFSAIEHGRLHAGDDHQRMVEWQRMKAQGVKRGLCDMFIIGWKRFIAIELKRTTGLSDMQKTFGATCQTNGHHYLVCKSVVELDDALRRIGLPIPRSMQIAAMHHDAELSVPEPPKKRAGRRWDRMPSGEQVAAESAARLQQFLDEE